jgi:uncharacterized protein (DUF488 family)
LIQKSKTPPPKPARRGPEACADVRVLVDVRLTPLSRKPGLSKTKLSEALAAVGIKYVHHRALGNRRDNRAGFRAGEPDSRARYREVLDSAAAAA